MEQERETRAAQIASAWRRATTEPREIDSVVHIPGLSGNYYSFTELPSFTPGYSWDVRRLQGEWAVFRSEVVEGAWTQQLLGYQRLQLRPRALDAKISALAAPVLARDRPYPSPEAARDRATRAGLELEQVDLSGPSARAVWGLRSRGRSARCVIPS